MTFKPLVKFGFPLLLACALPVHAQMSVPSGGNLDVPNGAFLDLACTNIDVQGTMTVGSGQLGQIASVDIGAGGTINGGSGTLTLSGNWSNSGTFIPGSSSVVVTDGCGSGSSSFTGTTVFNNLTLISSTGHTFVVPSGSNIVVNGTLTLQGTALQPIQLVSAGGSSVISLGPNATVVRNNANVAANVTIGNPATATAVPSLGESARLILALLIIAASVVQIRRSGR